MMLKEHEIKDMNESGVCIMCESEWTLLNDEEHGVGERYCENCRTHILIIGDEVYRTEW